MKKAVFDLSDEGHRASYSQVFQKLWGADILIGTSNFQKTDRYNHVVFLSADDYFLTYFFKTVRRSLSGKKTDGLLLRAENIVQQSWTPKRLLKAFLLRTLRFLPGVRTIGIVPFEFLPSLKKYLFDTIYDLQFWDLEVLFPNVKASAPAERIFGEITKQAEGRKIILALGRQDESKGILYFFDLWKDPQIRQNFQFVVIGKNRTVDPEAFKSFEATGGFLWNHAVSEEDLISSYKIADYIWCCYHPSYDVSSGIYGRSLQLGRPSLVREGSLMSRYADRFGGSYKLVYGDTHQHLDPLNRAPSNTISFDSRALRSSFDRLYRS